MSEGTSIQVVGPCHISVRTEAEDGSVTRRSILPGSYVDRVWVDTDLTAELDEVKALAAQEWTQQAVAAFKATAAPAALTGMDVWAEKDRRWALGFDYDFGDARGTHHIATTPKDIDDWNKVTAATQAAIALGQSGAKFTIYTDTSGAEGVVVTALEWQQIVLAAASFFQGVMDAAAALIAANGGGATEDYASDSNWP